MFKYLYTYIFINNFAFATWFPKKDFLNNNNRDLPKDCWVVDLRIMAVMLSYNQKWTQHTFLTKVCWTTVGAASMLETKVLLLEMLSSWEAGTLSNDSEGTPATSVPRDSREDPLLICLIHFHLSKLKWRMQLFHTSHFIFNKSILNEIQNTVKPMFEVLNISHDY